MESDAPSLFEMEPVGPVRPARTPRGRRRETWTVTTTATIVVRDASAVDRAFAESAEAAYTLAVLDDPVEEEAGELSPLGKVVWLVWPNEGLDEAADAGAFMLFSVGTEVLDEVEDRGTLRWEVTVKLRDVDALRRIALAAAPSEADQIDRSFAAAWRHAIDPYAPIRVVPGIDWQPGTVEVTHIPARPGRTT